MQRPQSRELLVLGLAAAAVTSLGISTHLEYRATRTACRSVSAVEPPAEHTSSPMLDVALDSFSDTTQRTASISTLAYGPAFSFVLALERPYLVLATNVDPSWRRGDLHVVDEGRVQADVAWEALPDNLASRQMQTVALYGPSGIAGSGKVGAPMLLADIGGDLGLLLSDEHADAYYDALERGLDVPTLPPNAIWDNGRRLLVAPIETTASGPISWARDAQLPAPRVLVSDESVGSSGASPDLGAAARLLDHEEGRRLAGRLEGVALADRVQLATWRDEAGLIRAQTAWFEGPELGNCGLEAAPVWVGLERGLPTVRPLPSMSGERVSAPVVLADLDLDGHLDIVMAPDFWALDWALYAGGPDRWTLVETLSETPHHGCPC